MAWFAPQEGQLAVGNSVASCARSAAAPAARTRLVDTRALTQALSLNFISIT